MIKTVELSKETIDDIFDNAVVQYDYLFGLYGAVVPDFEDVKQLLGYPEVSENTVNYIWQRAIEFDKIHHPEVLAGGCWMNSGFTYSKELNDWTARIDTDIIVYKEA